MTGPEPLDRLRRAPLELLGRIVDSSNGTFLVSVGELDDAPCVEDEIPSEEVWVDGDETEDSDTGSLPPGLKGVYKPLAGERPLWDFPEGLYRREIAAYELSVALGWDLIPATVERDDALGIGSLQRFVEADFSRHYFVLRDEGRHDDQLLRMGVFDLLANNTDRKGGHVLIDADEHVWGIDNGLCFSTEARLRTVIWDFAGEPIPAELLESISDLLDRGLPDALADLLLDDERDQLIRRCRVVLSARQLPHDPTGRAIPWPLV